MKLLSTESKSVRLASPERAETCHSLVQGWQAEERGCFLVQSQAGVLRAEYCRMSKNPSFVEEGALLAGDLQEVAHSERKFSRMYE